MKSPSKRSASRRRVEISLIRPDMLAFQGAAYELSATAYVKLSGEGPTKTVALAPKAGGDPALLERAFRGAYSRLRAQWKRARGERRARAEAAAGLALTAARSEGPAASPAPALGGEAASRIQALLDEAARLPKDPWGIARPWAQTRR